MLLFLREVKANKNKVDRKQLNKFTYKERNTKEFRGVENTETMKYDVRIKSSEAKRSENTIIDYQFIVDMLGLDFFKRLGKCKNSEDRVKICNRSEMIKRIEYFQLWFALSLKDRLSLLMLIKEERVYNLLSATITGEIIFGDFVNSIHSLNFLNDSVTRQMFDLCLLNS
jgi:hypothetical protein